jgi:glucosamine-6-phosphate deaminase
MFDEPPSEALDLAGAHVLIFDEPDQGCRWAAARIAEVIARAREERGRAVMGLATGSTPIRVYDRLVAMHRAGDLSFQGVSTYNLDEYYPIEPLDPNSYRSFMHRHLFGQVNLAAGHAHVLDGTVPEAFATATCESFERWIDADGGLDFQLLGIGRNGHIGFNEPADLRADEAAALRTRVVDLHPVTTADAAKDFGGVVDRVPKQALTMGTATILKAREIVILAFGIAKAEAVGRALSGPRTGLLPASLLRDAPGRVTWVLDPPAASQLPGR